MTKCKCDGCGWQGDESEVEDIDLNEWASYSDFDDITCLPVGECACGAPVYTLAADKAWALAKAAPKLKQALRRMHALAFKYAPIPEHGDGSAFNEANVAIAEAEGTL